MLLQRAQEALDHAVALRFAHVGWRDRHPEPLHEGRPAIAELCGLPAEELGGVRIDCSEESAPALPLGIEPGRVRPPYHVRSVDNDRAGGRGIAVRRAAGGSPWSRIRRTTPLPRWGGRARERPAPSSPAHAPPPGPRRRRRPGRPRVRAASQGRSSVGRSTPPGAPAPRGMPGSRPVVVDFLGFMSASLVTVIRQASVQRNRVRFTGSLRYDGTDLRSHMTDILAAAQICLAGFRVPSTEAP